MNRELVVRRTRRAAAGWLLWALLPLQSAARAETIYAASTYLTPGGEIAFRLLRFDSSSPSSLEASVPITGTLQDMERVSLEFDPQTRTLFGFGIFPCFTLCTPNPVVPARINPESGTSSFTQWFEFPGLEAYQADYDIHPQTRDLRFFGFGGKNLRFRLTSLDSVEDEPFAPTGSPSALAHTWPGSGSGDSETFAVFFRSGIGPELARIGGPGGKPPASSGEATAIGPLSVTGTVGGFDISLSGAAYLSTYELTDSGPGGVFLNRLYAVDLSTASVQELGLIGSPDPFEKVTGIAIPPGDLGSVILDVPSLSPAGLALFAIALAGIALRFRRARAL